MTDVIGQDLNPTSTMVTSTLGYDGEASGAVSLSGNGFIDFGDVPISNGSFSIAFWIKIPKDVGTIQRNILGKRTVCGEGQFFQIDYRNNPVTGTPEIFVEQRNNGSVPAPFAENLTLGNWMHVAYVKDNANSESVLYINGVAQSNESHGAITADFENNAGLRFGDSPCSKISNPRVFNMIADFDDLRIYDRALTAADVQAFPSTLTSPLAFSFPENATAFTSFLELTSNEAVTFSLGSSKDEPFFSLNGAELGFTNVPDFENPQDGNTDNIYLVDVISTDGSGNTSTQEIAVTITVADNTPPVLTSGASFTVSENGTGEVVTLTADEPVTFLIESSINDGALFSLKNGNILQFTSPPDFENPLDKTSANNSYFVNVRLFDNAGNAESFLISVNVTNVVEIGETFIIDDVTYRITSTTGVEIIGGPVRGRFRPPSQVTSGGTLFNVTGIGANAFFQSPITSAVVPFRVTQVGASAFEESQIVSVSIPQAVASLGERAFKSTPLAQAFISLNTTSMLRTIPRSAFESTPNLKTIVIPQGVTTLATSSFLNSGLENITMPSTITTLEERVFEGTALNQVIVNATTPPTVDATTFQGLILEAITLIVPPGTRVAYESAAIWQDFGSIIERLPVGTSFVVDNIEYKVTSAEPAEVEIGSQQTTASGDIVIPETVTEQGTTLSVTRVGSFAFEAKSVTSVVLPSSLRSVAFLSFANNPITSLRLPATLTTLESSAFEDNTSLIEVTAEYTTPPVLQDGDLSPFRRVDLAVATLIVPIGTSASYQAATVWQDFGTIIERDLRAPDITSSSTINFEENGTGVAYTATADETVVFVLGTAKDEGLFSIANDSEISFTNAPDFEDPQDANTDNVYVIDVIATDAAGNESTLEVTITVTDIDDTAPIITSVTSVDFEENGTEVAYEATADETVSFTLGTAKDESLFRLSNNSEISFTNAPDFENPQDANTDNVYVIDVIAADVAGNSTTLEVSITVTNVSQSQTITFESVEDKVYGDAAFSLTASASSGLAIAFTSVSGPVAVSDNTVTITGAGVASITATQSGMDETEAAEPVTVTFDIAKASLTVTAQDVSITEDETLPTLTFQYAGFVNGEGENVIDEEPKISTTGVAGTPGAYPITLSGGADDNYAFVFADGTLVIERVLGLAESDVTVYPNPTADILRIRGSGSYTIRVYSTEGRLLKQEENKRAIDVSNLKQGSYLLDITEGNKTMGTYRFYKR